MFVNISNKKVYELVIEQIQDKILNGELKKGDKLPSERELSEQMSVSRTSIREAIRVLETMGVVESKQGDGNFICTNIEKSLIEPLSMVFKLNEGTWQNVLELREVLELQTVKIAAIKATKEDCKELKNIIDAMRKENSVKKYNSKKIIQLDQRFHNKIASISKNYLIESVFITSSKLFKRFIEDAREKIIENYRDEELLFENHRRIYEGISKNDPILAYEEMKRHMENIRESYIKTIG
ncbi:FadR/GntR family transcriptional regulator [Romboutsia sp. 1001713B170131_170501_G6]|uniref:FadR/GntR family transcriptional regulator n=1 Tax=Romboutsia sp. 1001713B170131_170501_G6 TaxID=2787108 RepID=UPI0018AAB436|nr:FadR/GntR family transcriptional regulator [Romboutsia sp. 1001713B170131_170501_G6]